MSQDHVAEELDHNIDLLMSAPGEGNASDPLVQIAAELRMLANDEFRNRLRDELMERAHAIESDLEPAATAEYPLSTPDLSPSFSHRQFAALPADPRNFLLSFLSHAAVVAFIASGIWVGHVTVIKTRTLTSELTYTPLPTGDVAPQGGGGSGDHSAIQASRGIPPKFDTEQLAPPVIVVRSETPKLQAPPTVLGPPELKLPQSNQIGDLFSRNTIVPSNGTGRHGAIGDNSGTGIGGGNGGGVGPGSIAGYGGHIYVPGKGVTAPHALYDPDPEYSDEARRVKYQGDVVLSVIVDAAGNVRDLQIARSLGMGLDEKAVDAVRKWKFAPGMKDGHPVAVQVNVEVKFRMY
jgi:periplasmic protein TonB